MVKQRFIFWNGREMLCSTPVIRDYEIECVSCPSLSSSLPQRAMAAAAAATAAVAYMSVGVGVRASWDTNPSPKPLVRITKTLKPLRPSAPQTLELTVGRTALLEKEDAVPLSQLLSFDRARSQRGTSPYGRLLIEDGMHNSTNLFMQPDITLIRNFFYSNPTMSGYGEVMQGLLDVIDRLVPDLAVQDMIHSELSKYRNAEILFGRPAAIRQRATISPRKLDEKYLGYERWLPIAPKVKKPRSIYNAASLAYMGDCIYELYARRHFLFPPLSINEYNERVMKVVRCEAQDLLLKKLLNEDYLTEDERDVLRWGKNIVKNKTRTTKRAGVAVYNRASSLETLVGYLYLTDVKRLEELMLKLGFSTGASSEFMAEEIRMNFRKKPMEPQTPDHP